MARHAYEELNPAQHLAKMLRRLVNDGPEPVTFLGRQFLMVAKDLKIRAHVGPWNMPDRRTPDPQQLMFDPDYLTLSWPNKAHAVSLLNVNKDSGTAMHDFGSIVIQFMGSNAQQVIDSFPIEIVTSVLHKIVTTAVHRRINHGEVDGDLILTLQSLEGEFSLSTRYSSVHGLNINDLEIIDATGQATTKFVEQLKFNSMVHYFDDEVTGAASCV